MSQHDLNIANQGFPAFRADLNDALVALGSTNSGATAPSTTFANQLWYDTANNILKIRNEDNDAWISLLTLNQSTDALSAIGSLTLADIVSLTGTQTLTNKTFTTPKANVINEETTNSGVTVDGLLIKDGKILSSGLPAGSVLQVAQATFTGTQTISASGFMNWTDISSLSVTMTPSTSSSKFILMAQISCAVLTVDRIVNLRFTGGNAGNFVGDAAGSRGRVGTFFTTPTGVSYGINSSLMMNYLDSPATSSAITYKVQAAPNFSSGNVTINTNAGSDADASYLPRAASSLIVMEIAG